MPCQNDALPHLLTVGSPGSGFLKKSPGQPGNLGKGEISGAARILGGDWGMSLSFAIHTDIANQISKRCLETFLVKSCFSEEGL